MVKSRSNANSATPNSGSTTRKSRLYARHEDHREDPHSVRIKGRSDESIDTVRFILNDTGDHRLRDADTAARFSRDNLHTSSVDFIGYRNNRRCSTIRTAAQTAARRTRDADPAAYGSEPLGIG